jgi:hypothetical protein
MDLAQLGAHLSAHTSWESLEELVTSHEGFGLETATPTQRAVCWVLQNNTVPDHLWGDPIVREAFGGERPTPRSPHIAREVLMLAGIRGAKTLICSAAVLWFSINARLDIGPGKYLKPGERPRASLVSARLDNAQEAYNYLHGALTSKPRLMPLLVGNPTATKFTIRHSSGVLIDIKVVAMSKHGVNLISRWCVVVLFDEAPRIASSESDGKVNLKGMVSGVRARLLHGAPIIYIGSPIGAIGYCYDLFNNNWGKPGNRVTVIKAKGRWLNPFVWTPEVEAALKVSDYDTWLTDCEAEFRDVEMQMFSSAALEICFRHDPLVRQPVAGKVYTAWMDPGMRRNAWTFLIAETSDNIRFDICLVMEWQGAQAKPLDSFEVLREIKTLIQPYGIVSVASDQYAVDAIRDIARSVGVQIHELAFTGQNKTKRYLSVKTRVNAGFFSIPYSDVFRADMLNVKEVIQSDGTVKIKLAETEDGRHCDFAAGLALLCGGYLEESDEEGHARKQDEAPTEDDEQFVTDDSFAARSAREWDGDDEREDAGHSW